MDHLVGPRCQTTRRMQTLTFPLLPPPLWHLLRHSTGAAAIITCPPARLQHAMPSYTVPSAMPPPTRPTGSKSEPHPDKPKHAKKARKKLKSKREFNFSVYPTRKIALKFSYAGAGYGLRRARMAAVRRPAADGRRSAFRGTCQGAARRSRCRARRVWMGEVWADGSRGERCGAGGELVRAQFQQAVVVVG